MIEARTGAGTTAAHWAARKGSRECLLALLEAGADPAPREWVRTLSAALTHSPRFNFKRRGTQPL